MMVVAIAVKNRVAICLNDSKRTLRDLRNTPNTRQGWTDGFRQCETEQEALDRQIRMSIEQQKLMEAKKQNKWEEQRHLECQITLLVWKA